MTNGRNDRYRVNGGAMMDHRGGESLSIGFGTLPASVSAGNPATATISLADNSSLRQVVVSFGTDTDETIEVRARRWGFRITISLDQKPLRPVTIPLVVTHLGGATAADYTGIPGSVTFKANQKQSGFNMKAVLDEEIETGEGLRIDFGPMPPGVSVSSSRPYETIAFVDTSAAPYLESRPVASTSSPPELPAPARRPIGLRRSRQRRHSLVDSRRRLFQSSASHVIRHEFGQQFRNHVPVLRRTAVQPSRRKSFA